MRSTLILALSFCLLSCGDGFPEFPKIKYQYFIDMSCPVGFPSCEQPTNITCLRFEILGLKPYKIKFDATVPLGECNHISGFKDLDFKRIITFTNEAQEWADQHKCVGN